MAELNDVKDKIEYLKQNIKSYPDFPKKGVLFRDVFTLLRNPTAFHILRDVILEYTRTISPPIEIVVGLESKGFLFGPILSLELGIPFVPIRKKGKLPGKLASIDYVLEYGEDRMEIQTEECFNGKRVLIVDDLLATGGTLAAACKLIEKVCGKLVCCLTLVELTDLKGRDKIDAPIHSFIKY